MKLPLKIISILIILLFSISGKTQNSDQNTFSIKLNIPVFIDEMLKTEYVRPNMQDNLETYSNKETSFSLVQNYCQLNYSDNQFWGTHTNENFPYEKITIRGRVSNDRMILYYIYVSMEWHVNDESRKESEVVELYLEDVPMFDGYCFFDKSKSKIKLQRYEYSKTETHRGFSTTTHKKSGIAINLDDIPAKPMLAKQKL